MSHTAFIESWWLYAGFCVPDKYYGLVTFLLCSTFFGFYFFFQPVVREALIFLSTPTSCVRTPLFNSWCCTFCYHTSSICWIHLLQEGSHNPSFVSCYFVCASIPSCCITTYYSRFAISISTSVARYFSFPSFPGHALQIPFSARLQSTWLVCWSWSLLYLRIRDSCRILLAGFHRFEWMYLPYITHGRETRFFRNSREGVNSSKKSLGRNTNNSSSGCRNFIPQHYMYLLLELEQLVIKRCSHIYRRVRLRLWVYGCLVEAHVL